MTPPACHYSNDRDGGAPTALLIFCQLSQPLRAGLTFAASRRTIRDTQIVPPALIHPEPAADSFFAEEDGGVDGEGALGGDPGGDQAEQGHG